MYFLELIKALFQPQVGVLQDNEIDFIAIKNKETRYLQVVFNLEGQGTFDREFTNFLTLKNNIPKAIITMDDLSYSEKDGIQFVHAWEFACYLG
jgi:predicted AAA+ superfamily ATPase